jgi:RNA polymerase sigma factor (sigma-70 family)
MGRIRALAADALQAIDAGGLRWASRRRRDGSSSNDHAKAVRFEALFLSHLDAAYDLARWLSRHECTAEDVVQEACLRAFKSLDGFHGENGRAWLLAIVRNTYYTWFNKHRSEAASVPFDEEAVMADCDAAAGAFAADDSIDDALRQQDARRLINQALAALPEDFREVIVLRELEELSYKEIASIVGIPLGTVMSRLARARKLMLRQLREAQEIENGLHRES